MNKLRALWVLFQKGQVVADPEKWKNRQITVSVLAPVIVAFVSLLKSFGVEVPIDAETANDIAVGVLAVAGVVLTVISSDKVGLPGGPAPPPGDRNNDKPASPIPGH